MVLFGSTSWPAFSTTIRILRTHAAVLYHVLHACKTLKGVPIVNDLIHALPLSVLIVIGVSICMLMCLKARYWWTQQRHSYYMRLASEVQSVVFRHPHSLFGLIAQRTRLESYVTRIAPPMGNPWERWVRSIRGVSACIVPMGWGGSIADVQDLLLAIHILAAVEHDPACTDLVATARAILTSKPLTSSDELPESAEGQAGKPVMIGGVACAHEPLSRMLRHELASGVIGLVLDRERPFPPPGRGISIRGAEDGDLSRLDVADRHFYLLVAAYRQLHQKENEQPESHSH